MRNAELIGLMYNKKIAVISGVGVRNYYRKKGYKLVETYLIKHYTWINIIKMFGYLIYDSIFDIYLLISLVKLLFYN